MRFFLGTHKTGWLGHVGVDLFVSHRTLRERATLPRRNVGGWALDSGGFTELSMNGRWTISEAEYEDAVYRYMTEIGHLVWAAPQDWMCEPAIRAKTGKSVLEHQELTIENYLRLSSSGLPFIPVIQGWTHDDYFRHVELYASAGVDLAQERRVGIGSVCRRQGLMEIGEMLAELQDTGLRLHGFGYKITGFRAGHHHYLDSADSMAWSMAARRAPAALPGCPHRRCNNCWKFARQWRRHVLEIMEDN